MAFIFKNMLLKQVDSLIFNISQGDLTKTVDSKERKNIGLLNNIHNLVLTLRGFIAQVMTMTDKTINYAAGLKSDTENIKNFSKENSIMINNISTDMEKITAAVEETKSYSNVIIETAHNIAEKSEVIKQMQYKNLETVTSGYGNL